MATIDLGQFERSDVGGPPLFHEYTSRVRVVQITDSEREERCVCRAIIPVDSGLYLLNGRPYCQRCYASTAEALKPARGYYPAERHGGAPEPPSQPRPWRHRR